MFQTSRRALPLLVLVFGCNAPEPAKKPEKTPEAAKVETSSDKSAEQKAPTMPKHPNAIPAPADVASAPADAQTTASGLASKVITPGTGGEHPREWDKVTVHYTGWTTDGKCSTARRPGRSRSTLRAQSGDPRLDRGRAADGRGREAPLLDPREARLSGAARRARGHAGLRRRAARVVEKLPDPAEGPADVAAPPADAEEDRERSCVQGAEEGHRQGQAGGTDA